LAIKKKLKMKIQNLSLNKKKIIFWVTVLAVAIFLFFWWGKNIQERIEQFNASQFLEELNFPQIKEEKETFNAIGDKKGQLEEQIQELEQVLEKETKK